ncbi:MAG: hypothetical protein [Microvirus sp.]|nr:MAG: hypothetical protein [Microvirus sp.]
MKKKTFNSILNYEHTKQYATKITEPSMTVPDQSLTIPEIIKRFATGRPVNVKVYDEYTGDHDNLTGVDIRTMDISEIHDLVSVTNQNLQTLKSESDRRRKISQDKALEESIIAKYEARKKARDQKDVDPGEAKFIQLDLPIDQPKK